MALNKLDVYDPNVMISANDAQNITGMSVAEVRQVIKSGNLNAVAEIKTGKRGRPPKLYARAELLAAVTTAQANAKIFAPKVASEVAKEMVAAATDDDFDLAVG